MGCNTDFLFPFLRNKIAEGAKREGLSRIKLVPEKLTKKRLRVRDLKCVTVQPDNLFW